MNELFDLFQYEFFQKALMAALLGSIMCGFIGSYIVARRIVFISGGITHSSFGGVGIAFFLGLNPLLGAAIFALLSAWGIQFSTNIGKIREDSSIAIWWSLGMALGIIFLSLTPGYTPNLTSYLFGNILTVTYSEIVWMFVLTIIIITIFILKYKTILFVAFDENFAKAVGIPVKSINYLMISIVALTVVLNIRVVGIILILSLLTVPQATANLYTKEFNKMILLSIFFAIIGTFSGLLLSYYFDLPSGATIIFTLIVNFLLLKFLKSVTFPRNK